MFYPLNKNKNKLVAALFGFSFPAFAAKTESESSFLLQLLDEPSVLKVLLGFTVLWLFFLAYALWRFRKYQQQITHSEQRLKLSLWASGDELWDWDVLNGELIRTGKSGSYSLPKVTANTFPPNKSHIHPNDLEKVSQALEEHIQGSRDSFECAYRLRDQNSQWRWVLDKGKIVERSSEGQPLRLTGTFKDIQKLKESENEFQIFARSIESIAEGVIILDPRLKVVHINPGYTKISGYTRGELVGNRLQFNSLNLSLINEIKHSVDKKGVWSGDITGQTKDGELFLAYVTANGIRDEDGQISNYVAIVSDTTKRKAAEAKLIKLAKFDSLTGLPNRNVFFSNLQTNVDKKIATAVLVFDLDDFKKINDSLGHQVGDTLLQLIAKRVMPLTNANTKLYRLGGDEFALVMNNTNDIHKVTKAANDILNQLATPFDVEGHEFVVAGSIGIVLYPDDGKQPETLLRNADTAMYHAKEHGNRYLFFNEDMNKRAVKRLQVENLIRTGLKDDHFHVYYQPKMNFKTGQLAGMEALVRFITPKGGIISPGTFIPIAEETGQIVEIGDLVLRKSCIDMKRWVSQGMIKGRVAVNLSARQFSTPNLPARIQHILKETGLEAKHLELEITEGTVMNHPQAAIETMHRLRELGIHLAMDDFGTGYSSLSYLRKFPLNTLKIDRAFVEDSHTDVGLAMVDTIVTIARNLSLSTVAEGVETEEQRQLMDEKGCDVLQGYLYSKPLNAEEFSVFAAQSLLKQSSA